MNYFPRLISTPVIPIMGDKDRRILFEAGLMNIARPSLLDKEEKKENEEVERRKGRVQKR